MGTGERGLCEGKERVKATGKSEGGRGKEANPFPLGPPPPKESTFCFVYTSFKSKSLYCAILRHLRALRAAITSSSFAHQLFILEITLLFTEA